MSSSVVTKPQTHTGRHASPCSPRYASMSHSVQQCKEILWWCKTDVAFTFTLCLIFKFIFSICGQWMTLFSKSPNSWSRFSTDKCELLLFFFLFFFKLTKAKKGCATFQVTRNMMLCVLILAPLYRLTCSLLSPADVSGCSSCFLFSFNLKIEP